jgi:hypothetical protein
MLMIPVVRELNAMAAAAVLSISLVLNWSQDSRLPTMYGLFPICTTLAPGFSQSHTEFVHDVSYILRIN